ncbi:MAG: InlB B-repeat-containing protein [Paludibacteraceae bacterium]|nr:InlB B-repeat-containing protein [Paludibacteraceae bacterium]
MKKQNFLVLAVLLCSVCMNTVRAAIPEDAVQGVFSVGDNTKVVFAPGNLQYKAGKNEWSFATHQYDIVGAANSQIGNSTVGKIDLFGWGTGANPTEYNCVSCATTFPIVGNSPTPDPYDAFGRRNAPMEEYTWTEWGNNQIVYGNNVYAPGTWRTLTADEWHYLFYVRENARDRFSLGKVNGVNGLILLPDDWNMPPSLDFISLYDAGWTDNAEGYYTNDDPGSYGLNEYTATQWKSMEDNGAVFLPAAGSRAGQDCSNIGEYGYYWSSSEADEGTAYSLGFTEMLVAPRVGEPRASGQSVRLVSPYVEETEEGVNKNFTFHSFTINEDGGQVSFSQGNLQYQQTTGIWRFALQQKDYVGADNSEIAKATYTGWIDMFVYGYGDQPTKACQGCFPFGGEADPDEEFSSPTRRNAPMGDEIDFEDFGNNPIVNGGNQAGIWRTMTADEWNYLFVSRDNATGLFGFGTVDGVNGLIILPDDWQLPGGCTFATAAQTLTETDGVFANQIQTALFYVNNTYSTTDQSWQKMEKAGAVFLPAAGMRQSKSVADIGTAGYYWTSSSDLGNAQNNVFKVKFDGTEFYPKKSIGWDFGYSVRLVKDMEEEPETYTLIIQTTEGGIVKENEEEITYAYMAEGDTKTLTAVAAQGYHFVGWEVTEGGTISSETKETIIFTMGTGETTLTAKFEPTTGHTLTVVVNPTEGGIVKGDNDIEVTTVTLAEGVEQKLIAVEATGYQFAGWEITDGEGNLSSLTDVTTTFTMGTTDVTVTAKFNKLYQLTIAVSPEAGDNKVVIGGTSYTIDHYAHLMIAKGTELDLEAQEDAEYVFTGWELTIGETSSIIGTDHTLHYTMGEEVTVILAKYERLYTLNVSVNPTAGGVVKENEVDMAKSSYKMKKDDTQTLIAKAATGYNFAGWTQKVAGVESPYAGVEEITFVMGEEDITLTANFSEVTHVHTWGEVSYDWDGLNCTATRVCQEYAEHVETETKTATLTSTVDPTCETTGTATYTAVFENPAFKAQTTTETIAALGHDWGVATYEWSNGNTQCKGKRVCLRDASHIEEASGTVTSAVTKPATCDTKGETTYTATFDNPLFGTQTKVEADIMPLGHDWGEATYEWSNDHTTCTATRVCGNDASHIETEPVTATVTMEGTTKVYTAQFENPAFKKQTYYEYFYTLTVEVYPTIGGVVKVNADDMAASSYTMKKGDTQTLIAEAATGYIFAGWTQTVAGVESSYAGGESIEFVMGTEDVKLTANFDVATPSHEHTWGEPEYSWNTEYTECTATRVCTKDASHVETEKVTDIVVTTVDATCEAAGSITYEATFVNTAFKKQTVVLPIMALGHDWQEPTYTWGADYKTCVAERVCGNDASHNEQENGTVTETVEGGIVTYVATFTNPIFVTQKYQPTLELTLSEYGFLSLYSDKAYVVPTELTAIIYTGISGRDLQYQTISVVPAYTGVVFYGTASKTYKLYEAVTSDTYPTNMLKGSLTDTYINTEHVHYMLTRSATTGEGGWYWPKGTSQGVGKFMNHAGKAYLEIPVSSGVAPRYFTMRGEACEEVTAVDETEAEGDGKYYDVLGREVREPQPQQIYIHNGKKVVYGK